MNKHTPGPWTPHTDVIGNNPDILVDAVGYGIVAEIGGGDLATRQANARLIAIAPELLEMLGSICDAIWDGTMERVGAEKFTDPARKLIAKVYAN